MRYMIRALALSCCLLAGAVTAEDFPFPDYQSMRAHMGELFEQGKLEEAADLLQQALPRFPEHLHANAFNLAFIAGRLGDTGRGLQAMRYAHEQDVWFNIYALDGPAFKPYAESDGFQVIKARNEELRLEAQARAEPGLKVVLPQGYSPDRRYPLFIALHGGNGNMEAFSETWVSGVLEREFITAHLQSSLMTSMDGYSWTLDMAVSRKEIAAAYAQLREQYPVDENQVIIGGFSAGGAAALEAMLGNDIPLAGFAVLCPPPLENFSAEALGQAKERGLHGTIMTTEMDPNVEAQRDMAALLVNLDFPHRFVVTPDVGHWIPDDLPEMLDAAIAHIRK